MTSANMAASTSKDGSRTVRYLQSLIGWAFQLVSTVHISNLCVLRLKLLSCGVLDLSPES